MARVVHFEIPATDPVKVGTFYREVFGWEVTKWDGPADYWMVTTGEAGTPGINGGLYTPQPGMSSTINTIDVTNLDALVTKVKAHGGKVITPKMAIPGVGYLAYVADVEGTIFGMMQSDATATES